MARLSGEELAAFVVASCQRSGVAVKVTDELVVRTVTVLLTGNASDAGDSRHAAVWSDPPHEINPARVETSCSLLPGAYGRVVKDCFDDRGLTGEVEVRPLSA